MGPTRRLAALVAERRPSCLISASAIGYYGASEQARFDEAATGGTGFLAGLCREWEAATGAAAAAGVRTAIVRLGVVLGPGGGALAKMLPPFRLGIGGPLGNGRQWVSWVHIDDLTSLIEFLLTRPDLGGVFNATAPAPVTMTQLARALGRALHRPALMPYRRRCCGWRSEKWRMCCSPGSTSTPASDRGGLQVPVH